MAHGTPAGAGSLAGKVSHRLLADVGDNAVMLLRNHDTLTASSKAWRNGERSAGARNTPGP